MVLKLYKMDYSPPVRAVYMTAKALNIHLDYIEVVVKEGQHEEAFLKINPQHTIPTLDDNGKILWDSHAINVYLITKYGNDKSLYPDDHYKRAIIDQRLHFDSGVLFPILKRIVRAMKFKGITKIPEDMKDEILEGYTHLENFLSNSEWLAGDKPTLADIQILATLTSSEVLLPIDASKFPNIAAWLKRGKGLPYYDVNEHGLSDFKQLVKPLTS